MKTYVWYDSLSNSIWVSSLNPDEDIEYDKLDIESFKVPVPQGYIYGAIANPIVNVLSKCGAEVIYLGAM